MPKLDYIVLGAKGLIGTAVTNYLQGKGASVLPVTRANYDTYKGTEAGTFINCNGNSFRYKANQDPSWDFKASVDTVQASLFDFKAETYVYLSTIDIYHRTDHPDYTHERAMIDPTLLMPYAFHKWISERLVERYASKSLILRMGTVLGPALKKSPIHDLLNGSPLYMSPDSEISFIDTGTVAEALWQLLGRKSSREIYNVAATGASRLQTIATRHRLTIQVAPEGEKKTYRYHINNSKVSSVLPMPSSDEVVNQFLAEALPS